jgi:hypothetical protein
MRNYGIRTEHRKGTKMDFDTKREATEAGKVAKTEVEKEFGKGWAVRVWENIGWHFCLKKWPISVYKDIYVDGPPTWWALVGEDGNSGLAMWTPDDVTYDEPGPAIKAAVVATHECLNGLISVVGTAMSNIGIGVER